MHYFSVRVNAEIHVDIPQGEPLNLCVFLEFHANRLPLDRIPSNTIEEVS